MSRWLRHGPWPHFALALVVIGRVASAQSPDGTAGRDGDPPVAAHRVDEVVVTGSRTERPLAEAPVATEVISREQIERTGAETVADLLEEQHGLYVQRTYSGSGVQLQGLSPDYTLLLIDGQRITGRIGGVNDLGRMPLHDVERVELVRGAGSALYGSDAIGGVVNIITRRTRRPLELGARAAYGNLELVDAGAFGGIRRGPVSSRMSAGYRRGDGFDLEPQDVATNGNAFDQVELGNQTEYALSQSDTLTLSADYLFRDQSGIDVAGSGAIFDRQNRTEQLGLRLSPELRLGTTRLRTWAGYSLFRDQFQQDQRGSNALDQTQDTREQLLQGGGQVDLLLGGSHLVSVGLEGLYEHLRSERLNRGTGERTRGALFVQDEWAIIQEVPRLVLVPGARIDVDSQFGVAPTPRIALRFDPNEDLVIRAAYGLGFRAPDFRELYLLFQNPSAGYQVDGNTDLDPERSRSATVSFEYRPIACLWLSASAYRNDLSDMILTDQVGDGGAGGPTRYQYVNVSSAHTQGIDLGARMKPVRGVSVELGYSLLGTHDDGNDRPLPGRPTHRGTTTLRYRFELMRFEAMVRAAVVGQRPFFRDEDRDGDDERTNADPYATLDARVEQGIGEHVAVFVLGENLLDAGHPEFLAIQPRTVMGGMEAHY
ncbi:MAG: TonB-dependent receptor [Myxococcales bacterium]|nr:TonB-dependent receptor [Myxococcales bacterium]